MDVYDALNSLRAALLAAKDGNEVENILNGIFTYDEKMKIGRRINVAWMLKEGFIYEEIADTLKVGRNTINSVYKKLRENKEGFDLIFKREKRVEKEFEQKAYVSGGSPKMVKKGKKIYTGFKRKDIKR